MTVKIHFKTGKSFVVTDILQDFQAFIVEMYKQDIKIYGDIALNVHEVEFVEVLHGDI